MDDELWRKERMMKMSDYDRMLMNQETALHEELDRPRILFSLGRMVATPAALYELDEAGVNAGEYLERHQAGDWGEVGEVDAKQNDCHLTTRGRLHSAYVLPGDMRIWIITEADRSVTTILLPGDY
jgi:hypothetical protein